MKYFPAKKQLFGLLLVMSVAISSLSWAKTVSIEGFLVKSFGELKEDLQTAIDKKKKGVFIFFEQKDCPFCHRMKQTVLNQARVQKYFRQHFVVITVDIQQSDEITDFQGKATTQKKFFAKVSNNRSATPVLAFFDLNGKLVTRYTGATPNADEFLLLGEYVATKQYQKMSFVRYKRMKKRADR